MENIAAWKNLKVLVVDDSAVARRIICKMLNEMGVRHVFEAENGERALEFRSVSPDAADLIVCDWNMPGLNGLEVFKRLKESSEDMAFVMASTRGDAESIMEAKTAGVDAYLRKPFSCFELQTKITAILMQKPAFSGVMQSS